MNLSRLGWVLLILAASCSVEATTPWGSSNRARDVPPNVGRHFFPRRYNFHRDVKGTPSLNAAPELASEMSAAISGQNNKFGDTVPISVRVESDDPHAAWRPRMLELWDDFCAGAQEKIWFRARWRAQVGRCLQAIVVSVAFQLGATLLIPPHVRQRFQRLLGAVVFQPAKLVSNFIARINMLWMVPIFGVSKDTLYFKSSGLLLLNVGYFATCSKWRTVVRSIMNPLTKELIFRWLVPCAIQSMLKLVTPKSKHEDLEILETQAGLWISSAIIHPLSNMATVVESLAAAENRLESLRSGGILQMDETAPQINLAPTDILFSVVVNDAIYLKDTISIHEEYGLAGSMGAAASESVQARISQLVLTWMTKLSQNLIAATGNAGIDV